jgi:ribosomal protein S18 acetylase RimI-like enzyme
MQYTVLPIASLDDGLLERVALLHQSIMNFLQKLPSRSVELTYTGVAPEAQSNGIGHALLNALVDASCSFGYGSIELSVEIANLKALALFTKLDFAIIRIFREGCYERHGMARRL